MQSLKYVSAMCLAVLPIACKPAASSDIKTLENFALNEDVRINVCSAPVDELEKRDPRKKVSSFIEVSDAALAKELSAELILALSAVPDAAFDIFQARKGKILVTYDAPRFCGFAGAVQFKGKTPTFRSCMVNIPVGSGKTAQTKAFEGLTLVTVPDAKAIRHGIVRSMGYMVADTLASDSGFAVLRAELTKAFLSDVTSSPIFNLKDQAHLLGDGVDELVRKNLKTDKSNVLEGIKSSDQAIHNFMNYVVGESFDSYYCRTGKGSFFDQKTADRIKNREDAPIFAYLTDTRKVMEHFFPRTHRVFMLVDAHMRGFASKLPNVGVSSNASLHDPSEAAFELQSQTVAQRKIEIEQLIRQQANETRQAHEQWQQKKSAYDNAWSDVWGSKKSELDTAKAVYGFTQAREQALLRELRDVEAEEKRLGTQSQASNNTQFQKVDTNVATFDANAELKMGVQDAAKKYGEAARSGLGYAGGKVGGEIGQAFGEGVGDGVGGVLGAFGNIATDSIEGVQQKIEDTRQFANDLAVDPSGTLKETVKDKIDGISKTTSNVVTMGGKILTGDTEAMSQTARNIPILGNAYATAENAARAGHALYSGGSMDAIVKDQYDVAAKAVAEAGSEAFGKLTDSVNPMIMAEDKFNELKKNAIVGGMAGALSELKVSSLQVSSSAARMSDLRNAVNIYNRIGVVKDAAGKVIETLDSAGEAIQADTADPNMSMELLQSSIPGHQFSQAPAQPVVRPSLNSFDQAVLASPSPVVNQTPPPAAPGESTSSSPVSSDFLPTE